MSVQGAAEAVKEGVQAVAEKLQTSTISDAPTTQAEGTTPNQLLDEVTGEMVSKTELKKRQKARGKEAKKAEREAARPPPAVGKRKAGSAQEDEAKLNPNVRAYQEHVGLELI